MQRGMTRGVCLERDSACDQDFLLLEVVTVSLMCVGAGQAVSVPRDEPSGSCQRRKRGGAFPFGTMLMFTPPSNRSGGTSFPFRSIPAQGNDLEWSPHLLYCQSPDVPVRCTGSVARICRETLYGGFREIFRGERLENSSGHQRYPVLTGKSPNAKFRPAEQQYGRWRFWCGSGASFVWHAVRIRAVPA